MLELSDIQAQPDPMGYFSLPDGKTWKDRKRFIFVEEIAATYIHTDTHTHIYIYTLTYTPLYQLLETLQTGLHALYVSCF